MKASFEEISGQAKPNILVSFLTYYGYVILIVFGHIRDFFGKFANIGQKMLLFR